jgi:hypothetical protein
MVKLVGTFLQDLSLQMYQMGMRSLNHGKEAHEIYFHVLHEKLVATDLIFCGHT